MRHLDDPTFQPLLFPPGWAGRERVACRPLVDDDPESPLVAMGWCGPDAERPTLLDRDEVLNRGWSQGDLDGALRVSLGRRPAPVWRPLWLGVIPALSCEGDDQAATQVLRRSVLVGLHRRLGSDRLVVGVPHRGALVACDADTVGEADLAGLVKVGFEASRMAGAGPVCPHLLLVEAGRIRQVLSPAATEIEEAPAAPVARSLVPSLTRRGALVLRASCDSEDALLEAFGRELEGIARSVTRRGGFRGLVLVKLDAAAFPASSLRRMRLAALEQLLREVAASRGLRAPTGQRVKLQLQLQGDDAPARAPLVIKRRASPLKQAVAGRSRRLRRRTA
jgi:hypothetical protein